MSNVCREYANNQLVKKSSNPQVWEIWLATVPFEDEYQEKTRPVVIVNVSSSYVGVLSITSRTPKYSDEIYLSDWQKSGLKKPSTVKT